MPFSTGTERPKTEVPAQACDSHIHIFSTRFPASAHWKGQPVVDSDVAAYRLFQKRIGTSRTVVVTPSTYGIDNRATLDGVAQLGASARAVVVVDRDVTEDELKDMTARGAVGIRVNFVTPQSWGVTTAQRLEAMARKVQPFGWHVQVYMTGDQIADHAEVLARLPTPLVIDHLARLLPGQGLNHRAVPVVRKLLDGGRTWMKLSGAYLNTTSGPPAYADATEVAGSSRRRRRSGWSGAATGPIAARSTCRTMPACSTSRRLGSERGCTAAHPRRKPGDALRLRQVLSGEPSARRGILKPRAAA